MVKYICDKCKYTTIRKYDYDRHKKRKNGCKIISQRVTHRGTKKSKHIRSEKSDFDIPSKNTRKNSKNHKIIHSISDTSDSESDCVFSENDEMDERGYAVSSDTSSVSSRSSAILTSESDSDFAQSKRKNAKTIKKYKRGVTQFKKEAEYLNSEDSEESDESSDEGYAVSSDISNVSSRGSAVFHTSPSSPKKTKIKVLVKRSFSDKKLSKKSSRRSGSGSAILHTSIDGRKKPKIIILDDRSDNDDTKSKKITSRVSGGSAKKRSQAFAIKYKDKSKEKHISESSEESMDYDDYGPIKNIDEGSELDECSDDTPSGKLVVKKPVSKKDYKMVKGKEVCIYCAQEFTRHDNLIRHIRERCNARMSLDDKKEDLFQHLVTDIETLKKENKTLKNKMSKIKTRSTNIDKNINFPVKLVAFGKESMDHISKDTYRQIINRGYNSIPVLVKKTHFNANCPEYHNVYISNLQNDYIMVYNGQTWTVREKDDVIDQIKSEKESYLVEKFEELLPSLPKFTIDKFRRFLNSSKDTKTNRHIKRQIKMILYNNRKLPETLRKKMCKGIVKKIRDA
jgi:hypothetical protein